MNHWPNIISFSRGITAIGLFFTPTFSTSFWVLYGWCGVSDMIDGPLARKLGAESRAGAVIDSLADLTFVIAAMIKILPVFGIPRWIWIWAAAIAVVRLGNIALGYVRSNCFVSSHTIANKATGLLLFLLPVASIFIDKMTGMTIVCCVATFASIQDSIKLFMAAPISWKMRAFSNKRGSE